jgi:hypothetical protein
LAFNDLANAMLSSLPDPHCTGVITSIMLSSLLALCQLCCPCHAGVIALVTLASLPS